MKHNSCLREFAKYSSLNILGMIGLSFYILADTFFISKGLGTNGLTALNLAIPIYSFINGSGLMLGMGGATKYSILKSQKKPETANRVFSNTVLLSLVLSALFFLLGIFFTETIVLMVGADEVVFQMTKTYLQMILLFAPMFMMNGVLLCFVRNDGAPQLSMLAMLTGSISNVILDYIFIFPLNMGIFGAVLATGFAPIISMMVLSRYFLRRQNCFHMTRCRISGQMVTGIVSGGLPSLITEVSSGVVIIIFNIIILGLQGNTGVAAYGIIANLSLVVISIYTGMAQGIQPLISSYYGSGNHDRIQSILRYAIITMGIISGLIYSGIVLWAPQIAQIFNSEQNVLLQEIAVTGLYLYFTACLFAGFNIILSVYFTSTERVLPAHIISLLRGFLLIVPLAFLLSSMAGMLGVWLVFPLTELVVSGIGIALYLHHRTSDNRGLFM